MQRELLAKGFGTGELVCDGSELIPDQIKLGVEFIDPADQGIVALSQLIDFLLLAAVPSAALPGLHLLQAIEVLFAQGCVFLLREPQLRCRFLQGLEFRLHQPFLLPVMLAFSAQVLLEHGNLGTQPFTVQSLLVMTVERVMAQHVEKPIQPTDQSGRDGRVDQHRPPGAVEQALGHVAIPQFFDDLVAGGLQVFFGADLIFLARYLCRALPCWSERSEIRMNSAWSR